MIEAVIEDTAQRSDEQRKMSSSPDWFTEENYAALKTVLKWEIQHLVNYHLKYNHMSEESKILIIKINMQYLYYYICIPLPEYRFCYF